MWIDAGLDYVRFVPVTCNISSLKVAGASVTSRLGITKTIRARKTVSRLFQNPRLQDVSVSQVRATNETNNAFDDAAVSLLVTHLVHTRGRHFLVNHKKQL